MPKETIVEERSEISFGSGPRTQQRPSRIHVCARGEGGGRSLGVCLCFIQSNSAGRSNQKNPAYQIDTAYVQLLTGNHLQNGSLQERYRQGYYVYDSEAVLESCEEAKYFIWWEENETLLWVSECVLFGTEFGGKLLLKGDEGDEKRTNVVPKRQ